MPDTETKTQAATELVAQNKPLVAGADGSTALTVGDLPPRVRRGRHPLQSLADAFSPNRAVSPATMRAIIVVEALIALALWIRSPFKVLPRPDEVLHALQSLWMTQGL